MNQTRRAPGPVNMNFTYMHMNSFKTLGPYTNDDEARTAFQRRWGYWPENPISVKKYNS